MFTLEQIKQAHSKVRSGADFPAYISDLKALGVNGYETFVSDGHTYYFGSDDHKISSPAKYQDMIVAEQSDVQKFKEALGVHQQGTTDFPTFCNDCAMYGVEKWVVNTKAMTCTYYDRTGRELLEETIPG